MKKERKLWLLVLSLLVALLFFLLFSAIVIVIVLVHPTYILFAICFLSAVLIFNKFRGNRTFEQIYSQLTNEITPEGQISVISYIHSYLQANAVEIIYFNLRCGGIQYFPYCHYLFLIFPVTISLAALIFFSFDFGGYIVIISFIPLLFILLVLYFATKNSKLAKTSWIKWGMRFFYNVFEVASVIILTISFFSLLIYIGPHQSSVMAFFLHNEYLKYPISVFTYLSKLNINSIGSNQLSLSGFYISLAVGGTVVLSIVENYFKKEVSLKMELLNQVNIFKRLYSKHRYSLNLNISDIIYFDYINLKSRVVKTKKRNEINFLEQFEKSLKQIKEELKCEDIKTSRTAIRIYERFFQFIIVTYIIGIITILIPEEFATFFLWIFILDSVFFAIFIYIIYMDYRLYGNIINNGRSILEQQEDLEVVASRIMQAVRRKKEEQEKHPEQTIQENEEAGYGDGRY